MNCRILTVNLEGYGKGGLGTLAYDLHELLVKEGITSTLVAPGNPRQLPDVIIPRSDDSGSVSHIVRTVQATHRVVVGRNELADLAEIADEWILITGGTAYLQEWLEAHPEKTAMDFLRLGSLPSHLTSRRIDRERLALEQAAKILSPPGLNRRILEKAYSRFSHKIFEVPQLFRRIYSQKPWEHREIDLVAVAQWKDRGVDRDVKGYRFLADICETLKERKLRIVVVGEVPFAIAGVTHTGWRDHDETLILMDNARVFVSPSRNECYSQAIVEALQLGCNVVLSRNVEPHGFCHPQLIARYDRMSFRHKIEKAQSKRFPAAPIPSPEDSLRLFLSALEA